MKPAALGKQDHVHTCVLFKNKILQNNCVQKNFTTYTRQRIHNIFVSLLK